MKENNDKLINEKKSISKFIIKGKTIPHYDNFKGDFLKNESPNLNWGKNTDSCVLAKCKSNGKIEYDKEMIANKKFTFTMNNVSINKCCKVENRLRKPLSQYQIEEVRDVCTTLRQKAIYLTLLSIGIRVSELHSLNKFDIHTSLKSYVKANTDTIEYKYRQRI